MKKKIIKIKYDSQILNNKKVQEIEKLNSKVATSISEKLLKELDDEVHISMIIRINEGDNTMHYTLKKHDKYRGHLNIEKTVNTDAYITNTKQQLAVDWLEFVMIMDQLQWADAKEQYAEIKQEILQILDIPSLDLSINKEIIEICGFICETRKAGYWFNTAYYRYKKLNKELVFQKYKENILFIYLYGRVVRGTLPTYKTVNLLFKNFNLKEKDILDRRNKYYYLHLYLKMHNEVEPIKRTKWFYIRKCCLLLPIYIAIQSGEIVFPMLTIVSSLGILITEYLMGKNSRKYNVLCLSIQGVFYLVLGVSALMPHSAYYQFWFK